MNKNDDLPEEAEVRNNFEAFKSAELISTAFQPVLKMENELIHQLEKISQNEVVLVFRDDTNEIGVFELIIEQALHLGYPSPLYMSAESCSIPALNQVVTKSSLMVMASFQRFEGLGLNPSALPATFYTGLPQKFTNNDPCSQNIKGGLQVSQDVL